MAAKDQILVNNDDLKRYAKDVGIELLAGTITLLNPGVAGLVLGSAISAMRVDFNARHLSPIESGRVNRTLIIGANKFQNNLDSGQTPVGHNDKTSNEIIEGILMAAQHENEDRKIRYMGNLLGNIGFHPSITSMQANLLIRSAQNLSYTQLVLLQVFSEDSYKPLLKGGDYRSVDNLPWLLISYMQEIKMLDDLGFIGMPGDAMLGLKDVNPGKIETQGQGLMLKKLMELDTVPQQDVLSVISVLAE